MGDGQTVLATALLLLLLSPVLGLAALLLMRRVVLQSLRWLLLTNLFLTALTAAVVMGLAGSVSRQEGAPTVLRVAVWSLPGATTGAPAWWTITLSVGVDDLNRGPLCWLAWGAFAAGLMTSGRPPESAGRYAWLLALEAAWLWMYAAQDGVVFITASVLSGLCVAMLTASWGREDRRVAAARLWRWWLIADGLLCLGLLGLATAAVWSQQHMTATLPAFSLTWETLGAVLPRTTMYNQSGAQYWSVAAGWWLLPLLGAAAMRSGLPPFHSATVQWWGQAAPSVSILTVTGGLPWGWYVWLRIIEPAFTAELREQSAVLAGWGALATLGAGMLCLAQTDVRRFGAYFSLTGLGLAWFTFSSGQPGTANGAWDAAVTITLGSAALLALITAMDERQPGNRVTGWGELWTSTPLWSAALLVTIGGLVGFPAATRWRTDWITAWNLAGARPGPFFVALMGWFIAGWAAVWMMQRWLWGTLPKSSRAHDRSPFDESPARDVMNTVEDLRVSEAAAILVLLVLLGLVSSGWMTTVNAAVPSVSRAEWYDAWPDRTADTAVADQAEALHARRTRSDADGVAGTGGSRS